VKQHNKGDRLSQAHFRPAHEPANQPIRGYEMRSKEVASAGAAMA